MKDGVCPKCGSREIYYKILDSHYARMLGGALFVKESLLGPKIATIEIFACGDCGYMENYIAYNSHLDEIRKSWSPVPGSRKKKRDEY